MSAPHTTTDAGPRRPPWILARVRSAWFDRANRFEGRGFGAALTRCTTVFHRGAQDNLVRIGRNFRTKGLLVEVSGQGNRVEIGDDVRLTGRLRLHGTGIVLRIGDRCDIKRSHFVAWDADIAIGADCLIAAGIHARSNDIHAVLDAASGARLNPPAAVAVGARVWLAGEAALLKGARVPDGCVVGFRAVVTRAFDEPGCVLAGTPARVIRRGVRWVR